MRSAPTRTPRCGSFEAVDVRREVDRPLYTVLRSACQRSNLFNWQLAQGSATSANVTVAVRRAAKLSRSHVLSHDGTREQQQYGVLLHHLKPREKRVNGRHENRVRFYRFYLAVRIHLGSTAVLLARYGMHHLWGSCTTETPRKKGAEGSNR